jgi:cellulose synthase/poly-beta-1,6-N-acetylglucosamine synthase-like glycosyltransferase
MGAVTDPETAGPPVTVVVCSRDRPERLATALAAIDGALRESDRAVVVDSASTTGATGAAARAADFECVRVEQPGLSRARNAGLRHARTEVVAFTDDDCAPDPDWAGRISAPFADPAVGFVTGRVGADRDAAGSVRSSVLDRPKPRTFVGPRDPAGIGHGANMAFRRPAVLDLGLFDERLGAGSALRSGEDADMFYRCLEAGWIAHYAPDALVTHDQWRDPRAMVKLRYGYGLGNGAYRVKIARRHRRAGSALLLGSLWEHGLKPTLYAIKRRSPGQFMRAASWTAGTCAGTARGALIPLHDTVFAAQR